MINQFLTNRTLPGGRPLHGTVL